MKKATDILFYECAACRPEESILLVTDNESAPVALEMWKAGACFPHLNMVVLDRTLARGQEPPLDVHTAFLQADVIFCITKTSFYHSQARREATARGARFLNMVDYTPAMLSSGSALFCHFPELADTCSSVADALANRHRAEVTAPGGTHITFSLEGQAVLPQFGRSLNPGESSSPPDVECATCAALGTAEGIIVVDGSIPHPGLGLISEPIALEIGNGRITGIHSVTKGGKQAEALRRVLQGCADDAVYFLGEVGIGLNPMCRLSGQMLEDEGCLGTIHFGFGSNLAFGGTLASVFHFDFVVRYPTLVVDGEYIQKNGKLCILQPTD